MNEKLKGPAVDPETLAERTGTDYPEPFDRPVRARSRRVLGDALGLRNFGVNLVTLAPGCWSSQRHWHSHEDEFVYVLEGVLTLVTDAGEQTLGPGAVAGFPAGEADGHHLINRSDGPARYLGVGDRKAADVCSYPDIDLHLTPGPEGHFYSNKKGKPY